MARTPGAGRGRSGPHGGTVRIETFPRAEPAPHGTDTAVPRESNERNAAASDAHEFIHTAPLRAGDTMAVLSPSRGRTSALPRAVRAGPAPIAGQVRPGGGLSGPLTAHLRTTRSRR